MPIEPVEDEEDVGQELYGVLSECVRRLKQGEQISLAFALQRGTQWEQLSAEQRGALTQAAEELGL